MKTKQLTRFLKYSTIITLLLLTVSSLYSQPSGYCNPCNNPGYQDNCQTWSRIWITNVKLSKPDGEISINRSSGRVIGSNYEFTNVEGAVTLGSDYTIEVKNTSAWPGWNRWYNLRVYIDYNQDGDFYDAREYIGRQTILFRGHPTVSMNFQIPNDIEPGKTRMRVTMAEWLIDAGPCFIGQVRWIFHEGIYGECEDYVLDIQAGVKNTFPSQDDILFADELYDGTNRQKNGENVYFQKPMVELYSNQATGSKVNYYIQGPLPSTNKVYEALDPNTGSTDIEVGNRGTIYTIQNARGKCAESVDGNFMADRGGTYRVYAHLHGAPQPKVQTFNVAWDNDLAVNGVISPRTDKAPKYFKYLRGQTMRVTGLIVNTGLNDVSQFDAFARIWNADGDLVYFDSLRYTFEQGKELKSRDRKEVDFRNVRISDIGTYTLQICCDLLSANDQDSYNNCVARSDEEAYTFEVAHEIQVQANSIIIPSSEENLISGRTVTPMAEFKNVGIGDASDVPARIIITNLANNSVVFEDNIIVQDIQAGKYNTKSANFSKMTLTEAGDYEACIIITAEDDIVRDDDTLRTTFSVETGLQGVYTVGNKFNGNSRNFPTIDSVMNELYYRGITGSVVIELTDAVYDIHSSTEYNPALDFTTKIIGLGYNEENDEYNTITWRAHRDRASSKGGVRLNLHSATGIGILFGQSFMPSNEYALFHKYNNAENANSPGYVVFDGGTQKALEFKLYSSSDVMGAVFYLGSGSHDITVRNCLIDNETPELESRIRIPLVSYNPTNGYDFEADTTEGTTPDGYSAGIVNRATLLRFEESNFIKFDTVCNSNNIFVNNEISDFGYGIVSLGLGTLYNEADASYSRYYNTSNKISGNTISNVAGAGIFLGYEENSTVSNNRIYNVGSGSNEAAGIMAGGQSRDGFSGYNNIHLLIDGNEISDVHSTSMATGIRVEQVKSTLQSPAGGSVTFPDVEENMEVKNNVVWSIKAAEESAIVSGIHLFTERDSDQEDQWLWLTNAAAEDYNSRNDKIANNTIIISDDDGMVNAGPVCGIAVQNALNASVFNNAVAIEDMSMRRSNPIASAMFFQGMRPELGGITSDRNAYWLENPWCSISRFIELDENGTVIEFGQRDEFENLNQWQLWTGNDENSVAGNFTDDLKLEGSAPASLTMDLTPEAPLGSILDNRGDRLDFVANDIDGNVRGTSGQRYDIGAFEFTGRMYVSDVEMVGISAPGAYKRGRGVFSEAEYIMTTAPVEIQARVRNNGSLKQTGVNFQVKVYLEQPNGLYDGDAVIDESIAADIASTESSDLYFRLADNSGTDFIPQSYSELGDDYDVPVEFSTMQANVTPKYKIEISVENDQNNDNNEISKEVRFYIMKSPLRLLVSTENSFTDLYYNGTPTADQIAGRLNADSLIAGMKRLGWYTDLDEGRYDVDIFDRKGWEPKSVNYTMYKSMFWTDGDDKALTRYEKQDIEEFLEVGSDETKKNLIISSQEMVRANATGDDYDPDFLQNVLRAEYQAPGNPLGSMVSNDGNSVAGVIIGRNLTEGISNTNYDGDANAYCGLMKLYEEGDGLARQAYTYVHHEASPDNATMGIAATSLVRNTVNLGVDWRHWENMERVLRSILDYLDQNDGDVVPIELAEFNADLVSGRVDISWATASELNSARFEVEKAEMNEAGRGEFVQIGEMEAAGKSATRREYGPVSDYDVEFGNSYVYRLKLVDNDGNYEYSDEKVVTLEGLNGSLSLGQAMPNPAKESTRLDIRKDKDASVEITLYDMSGKSIDTQINVNESNVRVDLRNVSNGSYTLVLRSGDLIITRQIRVVK